MISSEERIADRGRGRRSFAEVGGSLAEGNQGSGASRAGLAGQVARADAEAGRAAGVDLAERSVGRPMPPE
jgi:hypothetical protein